jgi:hypothetical protein
MAQEDPEAVYAKLHRATLAGNADEVMTYVAAATKAELAAKPQAEREALMRALAQAAPKTYTITEKSIAPDGKSAVLRGTGVSEFQGRAEAYLSASFRKEGDAWQERAIQEAAAARRRRSPSRPPSRRTRPPPRRRRR